MRKNRLRSKPPKKKTKTFFLDEAIKRVLKRVLPVVIPLLFFGFFFFFLSKGTFHFLAHSSYFSIETVEASSAIAGYSFKDSSLMGSLLGRNVFSVNLQELQEEVSRKHPELLAASVYREFPNRIRIDVTPRIPVAEIQGDEIFFVDREGMILPYEHMLNRKGFPKIVGIQERLERTHIGVVLHSERLTEALAFLASLDEAPELAHYIHTIDVSDPDNLFFLTPGGLEVRVGRGDFGEKLRRFDRTRVILSDRIKEVKYIDLRFDDVVVGSR